MKKATKVKQLDFDAGCANSIAEKLDADILFINAPIERPLDDIVISEVHKRNRRKNVLLVLVTPGGDADAAYRISRCLQDSYDKFIAFVSGYCKSAGTLCIMGAHEIVMGETGELGPLDVQISKKDELFELRSGLVAAEALKALKIKAYKMFEDYMLDIKANSGGQITFKTATDIAVKMVVGLMEPLYKQIDPMHVGEVARFMEIATAYGQRLMVRSQNFTDRTLATLSKTYPSHSFVIDKSEVETLFSNVRSTTDEEEKLRLSLGELACSPKPSLRYGKFIFLSNEVEGKKDGKNSTTKDVIGDRAKANKGTGARRNKKNT